VRKIILAGLLTAAAVAQAPDSGTTIRATATEVLLDLVVRDKHGRPVKNLKQSDVEIYEDAVRQQILSFRLVTGREAQQRQLESVTQARPAASRPLRAVNPVCVVLHNLDPDPLIRKRTVEALQELLRTNFPPETYFGLFVLNDRLNAVHPFTNDQKELAAAVQDVFSGRVVDFAQASEALLTASPNEASVTAVVSGQSATVTFRVSGGEVSKTSIVGADVATGAGANARRGDQVRERGDFGNLFGMRATDQVITMIKDLGTLPGRKSVLLVSTGLATTGDPERFQSIIDRATRAGVTIYALDITGLSGASRAQAGKLAMGQVAAVSQTQGQRDTGGLEKMRQKSRQMDDTERAVRTSDSQASLRALAEDTGGFLIANTEEFRKPFERIAEDVETHYEAAYRPASGKYDGRLRKIQVKLTRADWTVESRTGYFAMPDLNGSSKMLPFEVAGLAVLNAQPPPHGFDFRSAAFRFRNQGALAFEVPGASLAATPDPARQIQKLHISLLALVKDAGGQVVDKFSVDAPYEVSDANLAGLRGSAATYTHPLNLPAGRYTVETAVLDREGGRASTNVLEYASGEPRPGIGLSSVVLVQAVEPVSGPADSSDPLVFQGKRAVPLLAGNLGSAAKPYAYFVVYPDRSSAEKPKIQVEFLVGGRLLAKQTAELPPADASGSVPMMVAAATRPGDCELRITAIAGGESATQSVKYAVAAQ
jgi:VWFA-related protein